jgi:Ser/Thr protein kinase RdoA (MazF antagonist)
MCRVARLACPSTLDVLVVCHGDVHPRNVLMRGDDVVIIDWDAICLGPPAWDHAALMTWADRWGGAAETYQAFAQGYGVDLRESSLAQELAALRLLAPTINMIINGESNPTYAAEAQARMRYWLGDPAAPTWTPLEPAWLQPREGCQRWQSAGNGQAEHYRQWTKSDSGILGGRCRRTPAAAGVPECAQGDSNSHPA